MRQSFLHQIISLSFYDPKLDTVFFGMYANIILYRLSDNKQQVMERPVAFKAKVLLADLLTQ